MEVGLQGMADEDQGAAEYGPAHLVEIAVAGVVAGDCPVGLIPLTFIEEFAILDIRVEAGAKNPDQLQRHPGMPVEGAHDVLESETVGLVVGQVRMAEADQGIDQGSLLSGHHPPGDELPVGVGSRGEDLGVVEFLAQPVEDLRPLVRQIGVAGVHVEITQEPGIQPVADGQAVGALDADAQALEHLHDLLEEVDLRRVGCSEHHPELALAAGVLDLFGVEIDAAVQNALLKKAQDLGHPWKWGDAHVMLIVEPEQAQQTLDFLRLEIRIVGGGGYDPTADGGGYPHLAGPGDFLVALPVELEALHLESFLQPGEGSVRLGELGIGDLTLLKPGQGIIEGAGAIETGQDQAFFLIC
jgi:hypothetical protein